MPLASRFHIAAFAKPGGARTESEDLCPWCECEEEATVLPPIGLSVCFMKEKAFAHAVQGGKEQDGKLGESQFAEH